MAQLEKFKLRAYSWDGDKDPTGFHVWIETFGSVVRSLQYGSMLEDMLDSKLHRKKLDQLVSSVLLQDPDFAVNNATINPIANLLIPPNDTTHTTCARLSLLLTFPFNFQYKTYS